MVLYFCFFVFQHYLINVILLTQMSSPFLFCHSRAGGNLFFAGRLGALPLVEDPEF